MNNDLNRELDQIIQAYVGETKLRFDAQPGSATKEDLFELSKQVAYVLDQFRKAIAKSI